MVKLLRIRRRHPHTLPALLKLIVEDLFIVGWEESTLKKLLHKPPYHYSWFALAYPCNLQLVPPCSCSSFELVRHEVDMLFLKGVSYVKELLYFIDPVQEGFDAKVPIERKNIDLHPVLS